MAAKKLCFEESLARLEEIVRHLESGDRPLDESLALFEEGAGLVKSCTEMLDKAEQKVSILRKGPDGELQEEKFEHDV